MAEVVVEGAAFAKWQALGNDFIVLDCRQPSTPFSPALSPSASIPVSPSVSVSASTSPSASISVSPSVSVSVSASISPSASASASAAATQRSSLWRPSADTVRRLADRRTGVGCDQLIVLWHDAASDAPEDQTQQSLQQTEQSEQTLQQTEQAGERVPSTRMGIFNADGGEVGACGNATRCIGALLMREARVTAAVIHTAAGALHVCWSTVHPGWVQADMGLPRFTWQDVALAEARDTRNVGLAVGELRGGCVLSVGNPHIVFFVADAAAVSLATLGPVIERHSLFPEGVNVSVAQRCTSAHFQLRVWERGAGETGACGTGACATFAAARRLGLADAAAEIAFISGSLHLVEREGDGHLLMSGPAEEVFSGRLSADLTALLHF